MKRLLILVLALVPFAFAQDAIRVDGSSTVYPISLAIAEEFQIDNPMTRVTVSFSGTGGGFERFCAGETDVNNASRTVREGELEACADAGIDVIELPVAFDALTVAIHPDNDFVECLTVDELAAIFGPDADVTTWRDVRSAWPDEEIGFFIPGTDSGTFGYFTEEVVGEEGASRTDVTPSEDDNVLLRGIANDPYAIGYFGFAYYLENQSKVKSVAVDNGDGCVEPSAANVENGTYTPLSRPLFIYVSSVSAEETAIQDFVAFYLGDFAREFIADTGYITLGDAAYEAAQTRFDQRVGGSVFAEFEPGASVVDTILEGVE